MTFPLKFPKIPSPPPKTIAYLRVSTIDQDLEKNKLDVYRPEIEALLKNGPTQKFVTKRCHTTEANLHH